MRHYSLTAPAKINLYLEIIGDRADGYHELAMILQSINLADKVDLHVANTQTIRVFCDHPEVPTDESNLAHRAAVLMASNFPTAFSNFGGVDITVKKRIPVAAGLAGGSTNAAAVLVGIDLLWGLGLTQSQLEELGANLGSDVPFCIGGGTAIATGRGEQLSPLPSLNNMYLVLAKYKSLAVSTPWAYQSYREQFGTKYIKNHQDFNQRTKAVHGAEIVQAIAAQDVGGISHKLHNDLEKVVLPAYPQVLQLRELFGKQPEVLGTMISGSGPSVFAIVESKEHAETVKEKITVAINDSDLELFVTQTIGHGIQLETGH